MYYVFVILSVLVASAAQILLKIGATNTHNSLFLDYFNPWVISGYVLICFSLVVNIFSMSHGIQVKELSIIESLSYLFVPCLSWLCFNEEITRRKACAIAVIMVGIVIFFI